MTHIIYSPNFPHVDHCLPVGRNSDCLESVWHRLEIEDRIWGVGYDLVVTEIGCLSTHIDWPKPKLPISLIASRDGHGQYGFFDFILFGENGSFFIPRKLDEYYHMHDRYVLPPDAMLAFKVSLESELVNGRGNLMSTLESRTFVVETNSANPLKGIVAAV